MQPDLQGLEITKGELKRCSGVSIETVFRPPTLPNFLAEIAKTFLIVLLITGSCFIFSQLFPEQLLVLITSHACVAVGLVLDDIRKIYLSYKNRNAIKIFEDVERYNAVITAIDINDQIAAVGNPDVRLKNRGQVIHALRLTREDIVRALKTERILRENENFIKFNSDLFDNNLMALTALQVSDQASEQGRLLNEALQIVVDVQQEMRKLQNQR
ncbi:MULTISPECIES: hypothetical protein [unclassified Coleofasciculus]|uniref:hypothetical protein n=1 Tax=unclassified Coleofasciculus TaxID=2692782 RepID=UPI0018816E07|nr:MULTISPECIES: hypothetical protein [unclassified Coleofasciculus]MBE9126835.1 hypothetical protein [Coleofasciculus sp. LEGE 07081]MBE9148955.1 hypothetical protein [Coleofasciculus sp. LEGE 07092]